MEKRKHDRIDTAADGWHAELYDALTGKKLGGVVNLSPGGMMLITSRALEIESLYQVECRTKGPDGRRGQFNAGVMVLWLADASQKGSYWVGLKIIDIDEESSATIRALGLTTEAG